MSHIHELPLKTGPFSVNTRSDSAPFLIVQATAIRKLQVSKIHSVRQSCSVEDAKVIALVLLASAAISSGAHAATPDSGLLITQGTGSTWQVRLIAGPTTPQRFSGILSATSGVNSMSPIKLESTDVVKITADKSLSMQFDATVNSLDGTYFWTPATSQIRLRDLSGTGTQVFVGGTLADAVETAFPLALQGEDPCGTAPPKGPYETTRKFHPGHYTALLRGQGGPKYMNDTLRPGNVGLMKRYYLALARADAGQLQLHRDPGRPRLGTELYGMQLIIMIEDKTFVLDRPNPAYLDYVTRPRNRDGGYTIVRWYPYVVTR